MGDEKLASMKKDAGNFHFTLQQEESAKKKTVSHAWVVDDVSSGALRAGKSWSLTALCSIRSWTTHSE